MNFIQTPVFRISCAAWACRNKLVGGNPNQYWQPDLGLIAVRVLGLRLASKWGCRHRHLSTGSLWKRQATAREQRDRVCSLIQVVGTFERRDSSGALMCAGSSGFSVEYCKLTSIEAALYGPVAQMDRAAVS